MIKTVVVLAIVAFALATEDVKTQFLQFQKQYNKIYKTPEEFNERFTIFKANVERAAQHQAQNPLAKFGVTKFMDLAPEEFSRQYKMPNLMNIPRSQSNPSSIVPAAPSCHPNLTTYDWNSCGVITAVKNQGQCGSCWAFSATETIESYCILAGGDAQNYAPEQIVDCDTAGEDQGCNGGWPSGAYAYVQSAGGIETEAAYPYVAGEGESTACHFNISDVACQVTGWESIDGETGLYTQVSTGGPVSVCVDASSWQTYSGGVLTTCGTSVDHCVQLTGYSGYGETGAYWIVRNSWSSDWGQNGYIWVQIGSNLCDIGSYATIVTVKVL